MDNIFKGGLIGKVVKLALFLLPIEYVAEILSVAVHEILGHGLSAMLLGGKFYGFILKWDAMGWAYAVLPTTAPPSHHIFYLASGVIAEIICGVIVLGLVFQLSERSDIQLALLVVSFVFLISGISYVLWNSYHPVPPGDIGRIITLSSGQQPPETSAVRWILFALGILFFGGTTFYFYKSIFIRIEELFLNGGQFTGKSRLLALFFFLALPGSISWFTFDWNQLAPGIGLLPCVVGALSVVAMAVILFWYRPRSIHKEYIHSITWRHVVVSCACLIATVIALALWFEDGVFWG